jgi:hypothetical protein
MAPPIQWGAAFARVSAAPGGSAPLLREALYRLLQLNKPDLPARWTRVPVPKMVNDVDGP